MPSQTARHIWPPLIVAIFAAILSLLAGWNDIISMNFPDPDDALRLVQVRDLVAGQSWFDVTQYRINPPTGGLMHWSRLIDLPIATMISLLTPLVGQNAAEMIAILTYSATMLALLFLLTARILRQYGDTIFVWAGIISLLLVPLVMMQFRIARIDHHSAIMLLCFAAFGLMVRNWRNWTGIAVGALLAIATSISLESVIYVPAFGLIFAWPWLRRGADGDQLAGYCLSFSLISVLVLMLTRGLSAPLSSYCDAMSRPYLAAVAAAALVFVVGTRVRSPMWGRLAVSALAAGAAIGALALSDPLCLNGPFAELDPYARYYWYNNVAEGLPIWQQGSRAIGVLALQATALVGLWLGWRESENGPSRRRWNIAIILYLYATLVGWTVFRSNGLALLFGVPGLAFVASASWKKARAIPNMPKRMLFTAANPVFLATAISTLLLLWIGDDTQNIPSAARTETEIQNNYCLGPQDVSALNALPPGLLFAQINTGPQLLFKTHHSVVATGHHRNNKAISKVLRAFIGSSSSAKSIITSTTAKYLAFCDQNVEKNAYLDMNKDSLVNRLAVNNPPEWLVPVSMPKGTTMKLYRVVPTPAPVPPTP